MNKFRLFYIIGSFIFLMLIMTTIGITGEEGIAAYYFTIILTFPSGLVVSQIFSYLSTIFKEQSHVIGLLFIPVALFVNYFQWIFLISLYKKWKNNRKIA